jgi:YesN/AraC family two-component response regulator
MAEYLDEITILTPDDCFLYAIREKIDYDYPVHKHPEFELNLILHSEGALRVIGDHTGEIGDAELVLVGSYLPHAWLTHKYNHFENKPKILEVTIQFHENILDSLIDRNQLTYLKEMIQKAAGGVLFGEKTVSRLKEKIIGLSTNKGFFSVLEFLSILHDLSLSEDMSVLCEEKINHTESTHKNERLTNILIYMHKHFQNDITLKEIAGVAGTTIITFNRFIKKATGKTFIDLLIQIRIGHSSTLLLDTFYTVAEIAYQSGFKNVSYFNKVFKAHKGKTPLEFREEFYNYSKRTII